jgi:antibiotic biosynthesis monooxygenase (ABM) superfamily enzyme
MLVLLVLFPIVMLEIRFLSPWLASLNPALATFVGNALSVTLVTWPMMPLAIRGLGWWLQPKAPRRPWITVAGLATVAALYALEIAALWHFL